MARGCPGSRRFPRPDLKTAIIFIASSLLLFVAVLWPLRTVFADSPPPVSPAPPPATTPPNSLPTPAPPVNLPSETPSSLSQTSIISEGQAAYRSGNFKRAHDLLEEALLSAGPSGIPPEAQITLASASRKIGHSGRAIALLLPLLNKNTPALSSPALQRRVHYELAMSNKDRGNLDGAVHQLLPIFPNLSNSRRIRNASEMLLEYWRTKDPVNGAILMGQSLIRLDPSDQKVVMTRTIDLIFSTVKDEEGLLKILSAFPREFPGDYAAYRLALLDVRTQHPEKAERVLLRMILYYSESLYISEAENLLNKISMTETRLHVGLILPDLSRGPLRPYMRSILTGAVFGFEDLSGDGPSLIVRFVTRHESYGYWYGNLLNHENIVALIGPFLVSDLSAVRFRLIHDQILAVSPTLPADPRMPFMVSMASLPPMVASAIAKFSLTLASNPKAVILYPTDFYGRAFKSAFEKSLTSSGGVLKAAIPISRGEGKRQEAVLKLRRFGSNIQVPPKGPFPEGVSGRSGDFVSLEGKSYYLAYPPRSAETTHPNPFFFKPDFDIIVFPNDSIHPFKVLDELVYKNIQNVDVVANESLMMARRRWDMVSDIHNPLYSVAPVNLFHIARGRSSNPIHRLAYTRLIQVNGRSPDLLKLESYDCAAFLYTLLKGGFRTRYHLGITALAAKSYDGLSGPVSWNGEGTMGRTYTLFRFSGGDWKPISTQSISFRIDQP